MDSPVAAGHLLVATAELGDPNFSGTVVLLVNADEDGALGVVLNRPASIDLPPALAQWQALVSPPVGLFVGGPVSQDSALAVALVPGGEAPPGFATFHDGLGLVDLDAPPELFDQVAARLRIFAGYAGWGADQLVAEIAEGSWYVVPVEPGDVFRADTTGLRRDVLRRQPGQLAWHATRPADPELN